MKVGFEAIGASAREGAARTGSGFGLPPNRGMHPAAQKQGGG